MAKRRLILGTAGHIDHGKTALVRALTGVDTDRLPEEKKRGMTIDIGFAQLELPGVCMGVVDVPGHERFVRNMLAGASGVDVVIFVVAADDSIMPQTVEHLAILELLGLEHGVVALTKCDLVDEGWLDLVELEMRERLQGTFLEGAPIVRTSATTGAGVEELRDGISRVCAHVAERATGGVFRLAIDRAFVREGVGVVVTGSVWAGEAHVGDELELMPAGTTVRVRGLQAHGQMAERVVRGQRAAIQLAGVSREDVRRGFELATPGFMRATRLLTVRLCALEDAKRGIRHRDRVRLHLGTGEVMARVRLLEGAVIEPGESGAAQLVCAEAVVAAGGQPFVVRSESPVMTIGGGRVLLSTRVRIKRGEAEFALRLGEVESECASERASATARLYGTAPWELFDLARDAQLDLAKADRVTEELVSAGELLEVGGGEGVRRRLLHRDVADEIGRRVKRELEKLHDSSMMTPFFEVSAVARRLSYLDAGLMSAVIERLVVDGELASDGRRVGLAERAPKLDGAKRDLLERILCAHDEAGFRPPDAGSLCRMLGAREGVVRELLELCVGVGDLVHIGGGHHLAGVRVVEMKRRVAEAIGERGELTVSEIRDVLDTSRKYVIPLCEYLDRERVTKRRGDARVLGERAPQAALSREIADET